MRNEIERTEMHAGMYTYLAANAALVEYYTTVMTDEMIMFYEGGIQRNLDETLIENCGEATMYILPLNASCVICIPAGESRTIDNVSIPGIKVIGGAGQKLRYSGLYYERQGG